MIEKIKIISLVILLALGGKLGWDIKKTLEIHSAVVGGMAEYLDELQQQKKLPTYDELKKK